jgi:protein TonB
LATTTISVSRILDLGVPVAWQEAVDVAHAVYQRGGDSSGRVTPRGCLLTVAGTVELRHEPAGPDNPMLSSAQLLTLLIEGQAAPTELRALLEDPHAAFTTGPAAGSLSCFPSEHSATSTGAPTLDWFVRPTAQTGIAQLAARALAADAERSTLDHIRAGARSQTVSTKPPETPVRRFRLSRQVVLAGAAVASLGGAALVVSVGPGRVWLTDAVATWSRPTDPETPPTEGETDARTPSTPGARAISRAAVDSPPTPPRTSATGSPGAPPPPRRPSAETGMVSSSVDVSSTRVSGTAVTVVPADDPVPIESRAVIALDTRPESRVYSATDPGVDPPVIRWPQLPTTATADSEAIGSFMEVLVDERGEVVQVRLRSSEPSLNDRMLVSAAKAWRFQPAVKDGHAVPYRMRIPVTR